MSNDLYIMHYGVGHDKGGHSGRYPYGSGENPYQNNRYMRRQNKKIYKKMLREKNKTYRLYSNYGDYIDKWSKNEALRKVAEDPRIVEAKKNLDKTTPDFKLQDSEPDPRLDKKIVDQAYKNFKKSMGRDADTENDWQDYKAIDYEIAYLAEHSKEFKKKYKEWEKKNKNTDWEKAYNKYYNEIRKVAEEFCDKYRDMPYVGYHGSEFSTYSKEIAWILQHIADGRTQ